MLFLVKFILFCALAFNWFYGCQCEGNRINRGNAAAKCLFDPHKMHVNDVTICRNGHYINDCNRYVCSSGPGEDCDPKMCHKSLKCCQSKCVGCLNERCFEGVCDEYNDNFIDKRISMIEKIFVDDY